MTLLNKKNYTYLKIFLLGTFLFYIIIVPLVIYNKGIFLYYGDFNSQQIPFYQLAHHSVRNGDFLWNWNTDLGANFIGSYSFYLLGSPFFWLTIPFPDGAVPYLIPILLSMKFGVATLTSFLFIKRFVKNQDAALIGALLYAFSGFQAYNVFFNHFHDVTAFFPLLLIAMEERVQNDRKGVFAVMVALSTIISYFFFEGEVVFCIIYFVIRCFCKDFKITPKKFFLLGFEAVIGVMISAIILLPSLLAIMGNPRTAQRLLGNDLIAYNDKLRIFRIIQSFFMVPDPPANPNLFQSETAKWSSIAGYLPLFSMVGVIAFMKSKGSHWASRLIKVCIVMAFIPFLNSFFSGFTSSYYARWFYMPILIMSMMTAYVIDNKEIEYKKGAIFTFILLGAFGIYSLMPSKVENETKWFAIAKNNIYFLISLFFTVVGVISILYIMKYLRDNPQNMRRFLAVICCGCFLSTGLTVWYGISRGPYPEPFIKEAINGKENISLPESEFYRVDISENMDNYPMSWGIPSMRAFQSVVPSSIMEFYPTVGVTRDVASRAPTSKYGLRGLFSVKYYFDYIDKHQDDSDEKEMSFSMPGFEYYGKQNGFDIYENKYYVPMGFTFDYYLDEETYKNNQNLADRLLMKAIVLNDEQIEKYQDILKPLPLNQIISFDTDSRYLEDCLDRAENSCTNFKYDTHGFSADITLEKDNLVFFSVPFEEGFTAFVDGQQAQIEKVDIGFMAVKVPSGTHTITFDYFTPGLKLGAIISLSGIIILTAYLIIFRKQKATINEFSYDY